MRKQRAEVKKRRRRRRRRSGEEAEERPRSLCPAVESCGAVSLSLNAVVLCGAWVDCAVSGSFSVSCFNKNQERSKTNTQNVEVKIRRGTKKRKKTRVEKIREQSSKTNYERNDTDWSFLSFFLSFCRRWPHRHGIRGMCAAMVNVWERKHNGVFLSYLFFFFFRVNHEPCTYSQLRMTHNPREKKPPPARKKRKKPKHPVGMIRNICTRKATFLVFCSLKRLFQTKCKKVKRRRKKKGQKQQSNATRVDDVILTGKKIITKTLPSAVK